LAANGSGLEAGVRLTGPVCTAWALCQSGSVLVTVASVRAGADTATVTSFDGNSVLTKECARSTMETRVAAPSTISQRIERISMDEEVDDEVAFMSDQFSCH